MSDVHLQAILLLFDAWLVTLVSPRHLYATTLVDAYLVLSTIINPVRYMDSVERTDWSKYLSLSMSIFVIQTCNRPRAYCKYTSDSYDTGSRIAC